MNLIAAGRLLRRPRRDLPVGLGQRSCWASARRARSTPSCRSSCCRSCSASRWTTRCSWSAGCTRNGCTPRTTRRAVRVGLAETSRVINSAALIMICVFLAFVLSGDRGRAMAGIGLAAAVALDAFILRTVLVPAAMHLLGDSNWWLPGGLDKRLPHLAVEPAEEARPATAAPVGRRPAVGRPRLRPRRRTASPSTGAVRHAAVEGRPSTGPGDLAGRRLVHRLGPGSGDVSAVDDGPVVRLAGPARGRRGRAAGVRRGAGGGRGGRRRGHEAAGATVPRRVPTGPCSPCRGLSAPSSSGSGRAFVIPGRKSVNSSCTSRTSGRSTRNRASDDAARGEPGAALGEPVAALAALRAVEDPVQDEPHLGEPHQLGQHVRAVPPAPWSSAPASTSRWTAMASTRACSDSGEKGLSGLSGSAAFLKNCTANSWYGVRDVQPGLQHARRAGPPGPSPGPGPPGPPPGARRRSGRRSPGSGVPCRRSSSTRCRRRPRPPGRWPASSSCRSRAPGRAASRSPGSARGSARSWRALRAPARGLGARARRLGDSSGLSVVRWHGQEPNQWRRSPLSQPGGLRRRPARSRGS